MGLPQGQDPEPSQGNTSMLGMQGEGLDFFCPWGGQKDNIVFSAKEKDGELICVGGDIRVHQYFANQQQGIITYFFCFGPYM